MGLMGSFNNMGGGMQQNNAFGQPGMNTSFQPNNNMGMMTNPMSQMVGNSIPMGGMANFGQNQIPQQNPQMNMFSGMQQQPQ